jgi:hypothetical protein
VGAITGAAAVATEHQLVSRDQRIPGHCSRTCQQGLKG